MPVEFDATAIWTLSPDRRSIRLTLQRLPLADMAQPLAIALRAQMLPAPPHYAEP